MNRYRKDRYKEIKGILGLTGSGTNLVKAVLGQIGLNLGKASKRRTKTGRFNSYQVDENTYEFMRDIMARKTAISEALSEQCASEYF